MADYSGKGRTNIFKVKDIDALKAALAGAEFTVEARPDRGADAVLIQVSDNDVTGCWGQPVHTDDDDAEPTELFVPDMIAEHLQDGQVAVFVHAGSEKLNYLSAYSIAVHANGNQVRLDLNDIYQRAAEAFDVPVSEIDWAAY
ncbi:hypothetical protein LIX17_25125 (plasmid) [Mycobacterium avium subsp. hominissuis]|uniref:hypothetical protein n=1 Tax=Mycobacterium avium TaxID=1764 RepID=UPI00314044B9